MLWKSTYHLLTHDLFIICNYSTKFVMSKQDSSSISATNNHSLVAVFTCKLHILEKRFLELTIFIVREQRNMNFNNSGWLRYATHFYDKRNIVNISSGQVLLSFEQSEYSNWRHSPQPLRRIQLAAPSGTKTKWGGSQSRLSENRVQPAIDRPSAIALPGSCRLQTNFMRYKSSRNFNR